MQISRSADCRAVGSMKSSQAAGPSASFLYCPRKRKRSNLKVEVPLKVNKGSYHFTVFAGETKLPLEVIVAQKGTYQTEFTTDQPNMQGNSKSTFTFNATLKNQTADQQLYALMANRPQRLECRVQA